MSRETTPMTFTLPYPPQLNHLYTVVRGRKILSSKGRTYKEKAGALASAARVRAGAEPLSGDIHVTMVIYRPRRCGDIDNLFKAPFDAVKGIAWGDDGQVRKLTAILDDDKHNPRLVMTVEPYIPAPRLTTRGAFTVVPPPASAAERAMLEGPDIGASGGARSRRRKGEA